MSASAFCNCFCVTSCHNVSEEQVACMHWHRDAVVGLTVSKIVVIGRPFCWFIELNNIVTLPLIYTIPVLVSEQLTG